MRRLFVMLAVVAASSVGTVGMATAAPTTYEVTDSWKLTYIDGRPTVLPRMEDDSVIVRCWGSSDKMTDWKVNKKKLVANSGRLTDGSGVWVQPEFTGKTETLTITVTCRR